MDTGRLSSGGGEDKDIGKPMVNLQNLPNDADTRACFVAEPGNLWISADYKGQESVLIANVANDVAMIEEFLHGSGDMHSLVAKAIFPNEIDCPVSEIKDKYPALRKKAKGPEFCFNYGGNDATLVATYGFEPEAATSVYNNYMNKFSGVAAYQSWCRKEVMRVGYIEHCPEYGHKAFIYDYDQLMADKTTMSSPGFWDRYKILKAQDPKNPEVEMVKRFFRRKADSEKQSINYRIQARGAICFKRFSIMFFQWLCKNNLLFTVKYCIPVHDEANIEAPTEIAQMIKEIIKFGDPWCQGCVSADTALEQLGAMRPEIIISKINIEEDETMAEKYKVRGLPTLVLIGLDGKEIGRHTGKITIQELIQIVDGNGL